MMNIVNCEYQLGKKLASSTRMKIRKTIYLNFRVLNDYIAFCIFLGLTGVAAFASGQFNVRDFGALGNGVSNDISAFSVAIKAIQKAGGGQLYVPEGTYRLDSRLDIPRGVSLLGQGKGRTVFNFTAANWPALCFIFAAGTTESLPSLNAGINVGENSVSFSTPPALSSGDTYIICNTNNFSFSPYRSAYKAGEFFTTGSRNGNVANNTTPAIGSYAVGGSIQLWKIIPWTNSLAEFSVICKPGTNQVAGLWVAYGLGVEIKNVEVVGSANAGISIDRCYKTKLTGVVTYNAESNTGYNYGLAIGSSQDTLIADCNLGATRHGLSGGGSGDLSVPCRGISITNSYIYSTLGEAEGLDFHGCCEYCTVNNSICPSGIDIAGDYITIQNCSIGNNSKSGYGMLIYEPLGNNYVIRSNQFLSNRAFQTMIMLRFDLKCPRKNGELDFTGNYVKNITYTGVCAVQVESYSAKFNNTLNISNNTFESLLAKPISTFAVYVPDPNCWSKLFIVNNKLINCLNNIPSNSATGMVLYNNSQYPSSPVGLGLTPVK